MICRMLRDYENCRSHADHPSVETLASSNCSLLKLPVFCGKNVMELRLVSLQEGTADPLNLKHLKAPL